MAQSTAVRMFLPLLYQDVFPSYSTQPHISLSLLWLNIPSTGPQVTWLPVPSPLVFSEQAQVAKCPAPQPLPTQINSPRPKPSPPSLRIRFHSRDVKLHSWGCRPLISSGGASAMQPREPPTHRRRLLPPLIEESNSDRGSDRGIQLLGVCQSGGNSLEGMAVSSAAIHLPRPCPHGCTWTPLQHLSALLWSHTNTCVGLLPPPQTCALQRGPP